MEDVCYRDSSRPRGSRDTGDNGMDWLDDVDYSAACAVGGRAKHYEYWVRVEQFEIGREVALSDHRLLFLSVSGYNSCNSGCTVSQPYSSVRPDE